ncbi:NAD(P)-binding domain-containing protein [Streptomyces sp. Tue6028]|uniref:NAD(P)-binding domain-containing protein n=1 Tax=Streptomyces sp. Tue6028 TaxID=2036037 RepID=UPI003D722F9F
MDETLSTRVLVVGAGPFGLSAAALARDYGIDAQVVGRPMGFWHEHMPDGMLLRSGVDWHLDATGVHTLQAYLEEQGLTGDEVLPVPVELFRDYGEWFRRVKQVPVRPGLVQDIARGETGFEAELADGGRVRAEVVVAAPGVRYFRQLPPWAAGVPARRATHSCDLVRFDDLAGRRVLIVGGRQSAYEWAALLAEHDADHVDIVHRHPVPRFEPVSWAFFDDYVDSTLQVTGWWRRLTATEREAIGMRCWQAGRATLEPWLPARLDPAVVQVWPDTDVVRAGGGATGDTVHVTLSNSETLTADQVVFATGYAPDLARVPYLAGLLERIATRNGFPVLDENFQTTVPGLYLTGFAAAQDFGPFLGFVKAAPAAATILLRHLQGRWA